MKLNRPAHIEVILPVYNEIKTLIPLVKALDAVQVQLKEEANLTYLFIDDGSTDGSRALLERIYRDRTDVRVIHLLHNFGHHHAISAGIHHFEGDIAVVMDSDLQDSPTAIIDMFQAWKSGQKTVVAERGERPEKNSWAFNLFYFFFHRLSPQLPPINFGTHCLLDRTVVLRLRDLKERNRYFPGLVGFTSAQVHPLTLERDSRKDGKSRVGFLGLVNLAITAFLSFSNLPIRFVSILGLASATGAIFCGCTIVLIKILTDRAIPGWASMMSAVAFASGLQLLCLGIIGEYVARIFEEVKGRPLFLVEKILEKKALPAENTAKQSA